MGTVHAKARPADEIKTKRPAEYEDPHTQIHLDGIPARVDKIHINGLARTKDDIVQDSVRELFKARDFQDVILKAHDVRSRLDSLGCFRNIGVYIDTSSGPNATVDGLEVTFYVREFKRVIGGVNTMVGNNEGSLVIGLKAPNLCGRGERIQSEYSYGSKKTNNFSLQFIKPLLGKHHSIFTSSIYQTMSEWPWSGYRQLDRGLLLDFAFNSSALLKHNLQWDVAVRDLSVMSRTTSFAVREQSGLTLKSALRHILSLDQRDEPIFPTEGTLLRLTTELAGFGGDVGFLKNDLHAQTNYTLVQDVVVQAAVQAGFLRPMNDDKKITLNDQFYLGGPLSLRGFHMRGVGPHTDGNALGSDVYWSGALHLYTPLPFRPGRGGFGELFRTHFFVNAGNVAHMKLDNIEETLNELRENIRIAYGLGVAVRIGQAARIELNYCIPLAYQRGDHVHPGVQFGIGLQFL